jgi:lambda family phage portal protein
MKHPVKRDAIKENWLDKSIRAVAPRMAQKRMQARYTMAVADAYLGGATGRRGTSEWDTAKGSHDSMVSQTQYDYLRNRSSDLYRNSPIATGAVNTVITNVVGGGLKLRPKIDREFLNMGDDQAEEFESNIEREWDLFANSTECDLQRTMTFGEIQEVVMRSVYLKGDVFCPLPRVSRVGSPYSLKIQIVDADRVTNENFMPNSPFMVNGIEKNEITGAPEAYYVLNINPQSNMMLGSEGREWKRLESYNRKTGLRNVLHLYRSLYPEQSRGIPALAPVIESLKMIDKYSEAEVMAAVVSAMFTVFVKTETGDLGLNPMEPTTETGATTSDDSIKLASGAVVGLAPDESIEIANPQRPNRQFDAFVQSVLRQIGVALELPFEYLTKHFTSSYSASRVSIMEAWRFFMNRRRWLASSFCSRVYEVWFYEAVALGRIKAPGFYRSPRIRRAYLKSDWIGPARGHIDELKEIQAVEKRISLGISTHTQETIEQNGGDWRLNQKKLKSEQDLKSSMSSIEPEPEGQEEGLEEGDIIETQTNNEEQEIEDETA